MKSPFKFLDAYTLQDKDAFFGRELEIESLYTLVFKTPLLLVYGLSGTGKTSLIQCGLASRFDGTDWYPVFIRRNDNINHSMTSVMKNVLGDLATDNMADNVSLLLRKTLRPVYLLFDQFEELFVLGKEEEQLTFMTSIRELLDAQLPSKIILIMREEYIGQLYSSEKLIPELFDHRFRVEPMGPSKVKSVINSSFEKFNIELAEPKAELLETMVQNISDPRSGITLPYLQVYLDMLYRDKYRKQFPQDTTEVLPGIAITKNEVAHIGKIENVLERFLEDQIRELQEQLSSKNKYVRPNVVQSLLDIFVSDEGTKRPIRYKQTGDQIFLVDEVAASIQDIPIPMLTEMLNTLQQDRILRRGDDHFELAHDSLALIIDSKRSEYQRRLQSVRKRLMNAFDEYNKTGAFLNQKQLASFEEFLPYIALSKEIKQFLDKCEADIVRRTSEEKDRLQQEHQIQQQKKLARTRKTWLVVASCLAGIAVFMALQSSTRANQLQEEKNISNHQRDSTANILAQVQQQFGRMDSIASGSLPQSELVKTLITLKSFVSNDTMDVTKMEAEYISVNRMLMTNDTAKGTGTVREDSIFQSSKVNVALYLKTPQPSEFIQLKWMSADGKIIGEPYYVEVKADSSSKWIIATSTVNTPGNYRVEVYNSQGIEVGRKNFRVAGAEVKEASPREASMVSKDLFFTTISYDRESKKSGKKVTTFKAGQSIYYVANINSPKDADVVYVKLIDPKGKIIWNIPHKILRNTSAGYRIWSGNSIKIPGTYYLKLENSQGLEMAGFTLTII